MHFLSNFFFLCLNSNRHYFWKSTATELRKWLWDVWIWFKIVFEHFQNMHWSITGQMDPHPQGFSDLKIEALKQSSEIFSTCSPIKNIFWH